MEPDADAVLECVVVDTAVRLDPVELGTDVVLEYPVVDTTVLLDSAELDAAVVIGHAVLDNAARLDSVEGRQGPPQIRGRGGPELPETPQALLSPQAHAICFAACRVGCLQRRPVCRSGAGTARGSRSDRHQARRMPRRRHRC